MTEQPKYTVGDPVWSKMKGYCPWPSRIADPSESNLKNTAADKLKVPKVHYLVYFFGSNNFAWMAEDCIKPYAEFKEKNKNGAKSGQFKAGLKQIEDYIETGGPESLVAEYLHKNNSSAAAIKNNDDASSPSAGDLHSNDHASNNDGDLMSIDEEINTITSKRPAHGSGKKSSKATAASNLNDSQNDSSSLTSPVSVQKDYSRTPFKNQRKSAARGGDESATTEFTSPSKRVKTDDESCGVSSLSSPTISTNIASSKPQLSSRTSAARSTIMRATQFDIPVTDTPQINVGSISAKSRSIKASNLKFGFIGLGFLGQRLLKNLLDSGHNVTIYNRTTSKCKEFEEAGAQQVTTPADVVLAADVIFLCLPGPTASKEVVFGPFGILTGMDVPKGLVELSSIDPETSNDISEAIIARGGRYLEAPPITNNKRSAEDGELTIVASGDKSLFEDCSSCFQAIAKKSFFLSHTVGQATKMNLAVSMLYGSIVATISECSALIERIDQVSLEQFKEVLGLSVMNCPLVLNSIDTSIAARKTSNLGEIQVPLQHVQKNLMLALNLADELEHPTPITAVTNEVFKNARRHGYSDYDISAVYLRNRW